MVAWSVVWMAVHSVASRVETTVVALDCLMVASLVLLMEGRLVE